MVEFKQRFPLGLNEFALRDILEVDDADPESLPDDRLGRLAPLALTLAWYQTVAVD